MKNIITFLEKNGQKDFQELPFNDVDSAVLSELSYLIYDGLVADEEIALNTFNNKDDFKKLTDETLEDKSNIKLLKALFASKRYADITISDYLSVTNDSKQIQFASMTFRFSNHVYVAYRGTDVSILGWQEDFNLAFMNIIPGQIEGVNYLKSIIEKTPLDKTIIVGGHSKGGNLALYSCIYIEKELQDRISKVYDHDGPGFKDNVHNDARFKAIEDRISKTVPHDSCIGILLSDYKKYKVVRSSRIGILQHSLFSWVIKGQDFHYLPKTTKNSMTLDNTLSQWLNSLSDDERKSIVNAIFSLFHNSQISTVLEFKKKTIPTLRRLMKAIKSTTKEQRKSAKKQIKKLIKLYINNRFKRTKKLERQDAKEASV